MAMTMAILRVGELVKNLSQEFRNENQQVKWKAIADFRDIILTNMKRLIWRKFTKTRRKAPCFMKGAKKLANNKLGV